MKAAELKTGQLVTYLGSIEARVIEVCTNGVRIEYWGVAPWNRDKLKRSRVSIRDLSPSPRKRYTPKPPSAPQGANNSGDHDAKSKRT